MLKIFTYMTTFTGMPLKLIKATRHELPGIRDFLLEIGSGENGFVGTDFGRGLGTLEETLLRMEGMSSRTSLAPENAEIALGAQEDILVTRCTVPMTTFWLYDATDRPIGISRLRHELNESLLIRGGHIGYYIRRTDRGKGLGSFLLAATLNEARKLGIDRVLLTANTDNPASIRTIEANGGIREDSRIDDDGIEYGRYWIILPR